MKINRQTKLITAHALVWAWLMISIAYFIPATVNHHSILIFLISGWFISQSILIASIRGAKANEMTGNSQNEQSQITCVERLFNTIKKK